MQTRPFILAASMLISTVFCAPTFAADAPTLMPDEIVNANTEPKSFLPQSLQVKTKFDVPNSSLVSDIQYTRVVPTKVSDDTGLSLLNPERYEAKWQPHYGFGAPDIELDAPARGAQTLPSLSGFAELYRPKDDPASVITIPNISQLAPQTLDNPILKAANIRITLITYGELGRYRKSLKDPKIAYPAASGQIIKREVGRGLPYYLENIKSSNQASFTLYVRDPGNRLVDEEIEVPDGKKFSVSIGHMRAEGITTFLFSKTPPADFGLKLTIATPKSTTRIPFDFTNLALPARAPVPAVVATDINDDRQPASSLVPSSLDMKLKIALPEVEQARNVRVSLASATDATGKTLLKTELSKDRWEEVEATDNRQTTNAKIRLDSPARGALTLREVTGKIEFYDPTRDPQSVITVTEITAQSGQILDDPTLKSLGLEVAFLNKAQLERDQNVELAKPAPADRPNLTPEIKTKIFDMVKELFGVLTVDEKTLAFRITDPNARFVDVGLETADGQTIKRVGRSRSDTLQTYQFEDAIPADAKLKIYVATPKSVVTVPFKLTDVPLP